MLSGVRNTYEHQMIIAQLIHGFMNHFTYKKYSKYIATPETSFSNLDLTTPDLMIWNMKESPENSTALVVEICHQKALNNDVQKVSEIISNYSTVQEAFIIVMDPLTIYRVYSKKDGMPSQKVKSDRCELLNLNVGKFIKF